MTQGKWTPKAKPVKEIVAWAQELLAEVRTTRNVHFIHVRGHSSDEGNDRADALVQWGKKKEERSRLREYSPDWQEEIIITREGPIESDGTYGRLAMEEQAKEKKEKERQKEAERNSTSRRRQKQPSVGAAVFHHQTPNDPEPSSGRSENPGSNDDARVSSSSNTSSSSNRGTPSGHSSRRRERRRRSACERKSMFVE